MEFIGDLFRRDKDPACRNAADLLDEALSGCEVSKSSFKSSESIIAMTVKLALGFADGEINAILRLSTLGYVK